MPAPVSKAAAAAASLTLFAGLRERPLLLSFEGLAAALAHGERGLPLLERWAAFAREAAAYSSWGLAVERAALGAENRFTLAAEERGRGMDSRLFALGRLDLEKLQCLAELDLPSLARETASRIREDDPDAARRVEAEGEILAEGERYGEQERAGFHFGPGSWAARSEEAADFLHESGAGLFQLSSSFSWQGGRLRPALAPDLVRLSDLCGYEEQREVVLNNTRAFVERGSRSARSPRLSPPNLLLYGDRGTGKSATVKAVANEFAPSGLRLIEVGKKDCAELPALLALLGQRPALRFILFIDDLAFQTDDDAFNTLKGLLEGGVEEQPENVLVYATSNRRHFVKERQAERPAASDDVRAFDTLQEQLSLADRFGICVVYTAPDQETYLRIASFLARQAGLLPPGDSAALSCFRENALRWERWYNGRSPRTARQYVAHLATGAPFPWA